jgi:hypothetical protein
MKKVNLVFPFPCVVLQSSTPFTNPMSFKTVWWISHFSIIAWRVVLSGVKSINVCVLKETSRWHTNQRVDLRRQPPELLVEPLNRHILDTFSPNLQLCSTRFQWSCNHHCTALFQNPRPPPIQRIRSQRDFLPCAMRLSPSVVPRAVQSMHFMFISFELTPYI